MLPCTQHNSSISLTWSLWTSAWRRSWPGAHAGSFGSASECGQQPPLQTQSEEWGGGAGRERINLGLAGALLLPTTLPPKSASELERVPLGVLLADTPPAPAQDIHVPSQPCPLPEQVLCLHRLSGHPVDETRADETEKSRVMKAMTCEIQGHSLGAARGRNCGFAVFGLWPAQGDSDP